MLASWLVFLLSASLTRAGVFPNKIPTILLKELEQEGRTNVFLQFPPINWEEAAEGLLEIQKRHGELAVSFADMREAGFGWRRARRIMVADLLKEHAKTTQHAVIATLEEAGYKYKSFWINNSLFVENAPSHLVFFLSNVNGMKILGNTKVGSVPPLWNLIQNDSSETGSSVLWNLELIGADQAWKHSQGAGVTVASIDTGVNWNHELLQSQYRGIKRNKQLGLTDYNLHDYSWHDPKGKSPVPNDHHGHGTHTLGSVVGKKVGVAPEATWIAARGCTTQGCLRHDLLAAAQWVLCPTKIDGGEERCDLGADIVTNSWGADPNEEDEEEGGWFEPIAKAWVSAGIVPIFAIGNAGPSCNTAGSPGDLPSVIGVGSVTREKSLSQFSSRGPGSYRKAKHESMVIKPDLVAPGQDIISTFNDGSLILMSGTSMATPHVAGVVALMVSVDPTIDKERAQSILLKTAQSKGLGEPVLGQLSCLDKRWDQMPNHQYGYGLVDANEAVSLVKREVVAGPRFFFF